MRDDVSGSGTKAQNKIPTIWNSYYEYKLRLAIANNPTHCTHLEPKLKLHSGYPLLPLTIDSCSKNIIWQIDGF
jgi:hypothetical protein